MATNFSILAGEFQNCIIHGVAKSWDTTKQLSLSLDIRNSLFATVLILGVGKKKKKILYTKTIKILFWREVISRQTLTIILYDCHLNH